MPRIFFALWPDNQVRDQLCELQDQLKLPGARRVPRENLHITVEFLGSVSDEILASLKKRTQALKLSAFDLQLTRLGYWKKPKVVWAATEQTPVPLQVLVSDIRAWVVEAGLEPERREFIPHLTLFRKVTPPFQDMQIEPIQWTVDSLSLVSSNTLPDGAVYQTIARSRLCE